MLGGPPPARFRYNPRRNSRTASAAPPTAPGADSQAEPPERLLGLAFFTKWPLRSIAMLLEGPVRIVAELLCQGSVSFVRIL